MEFNVLKSGGFVKKYRPIIFTITQDEFFYKKKKSEEKFQKYHISYLNEVYIQQQQKEKPEYSLILEMNPKNMLKKKKDKKDKKIKIIKLAMKDDKNTSILSDIKRILNIQRLQYDIHLFLFNWKLKTNISINIDKLNDLKDEKKVYNIKHAIMEKIEKENKKDKLNDLLSEKLNNFIKELNKDNLNIDLLDDEIIKTAREIFNGSFILENDEHQEDKSLKQFKDIDNFNKIYLNLIKLFTRIKFCYILKRFKRYDKKYLLEFQVYNKNDNNTNKIEIDSKENEEEIDIIHSSTLIDKNDNEIKIDDIDSKMTKKKEQNERIQSRILAGLNSNSKMKENLKNLILSQNKKLYFCIKCNSLIEKTLVDKANCNFDKSCTTRSFFYCKKCKLHLCTKCVVYQRGMKCYKNHKYFQRPVNTEEDIKCLICNKPNNFPYYECKFCKEQICSNCSIPPSTRVSTCFNCNNELIWRKCIYTSCDRCHKLCECFYFCVCCDYSICINCSSIPKKFCGALHNLKEIDLMNDFCFNDNDNQSFQFNKYFCYNYPVLFSGKCSWCNITIGKGKIWSCLRCSLFLCDKCVKKNSD